MKLLLKAKAPRWLALAILSLCVISPAFKARAVSVNRTSQDDRSTSSRAWPGKQFVCGYDPRGAEDEWHNHKLNALRLNEGRALSKDITAMARGNAGLQSQDVGDISVIED